MLKAWLRLPENKYPILHNLDIWRTSAIDAAITALLSSKEVVEVKKLIEAIDSKTQIVLGGNRYYVAVDDVLAIIRQHTQEQAK